ncbi:hypothetical protein EJB05_25654, partial [Eragrostis curvula]
MVEVAPLRRNKLCRPFLCLVGLCICSGDGLGDCYLAGSGVPFEASNFDGEFFCPSLSFFGIGTGDGVLSGEAVGRSMLYRPGRSGWFLDPTSSGGLHPLLGVLCSGELGLMLAASDPFYTGEAMVFDHLVRPARSSCFVGKVVGLEASPPAAGDENDREFLTRTYLYFSFLPRVSL